jgi:hypothetical protein
MSKRPPSAYGTSTSPFEPAYVFLFVCGMMMLQLPSTKTKVPETTGVSLEELQRRLAIV